MVKNKTSKIAPEGVSGSGRKGAVRCTLKRYSMFDFIRAIRERAVLWNHNHEYFSNRLEREKMWHEIARELLSNFEQSKTSEKQAMVQMLQKRWKNSRDSYLRAERLKQTTGEERGYIYERELDFLLNSKFDSNGGKDKQRRTAESNLPASDNNRAENPPRKVETGKKRNAAAATANEKQAKPRHRSTLSGSAKPKSRILPQKKRCNSSLDSLCSFDVEMSEVCQEIEDQLQGAAVDDDVGEASLAATAAAAAGKGEGQPQDTELESHNTNNTNNMNNTNSSKDSHHNSPQKHCSKLASEPDPDQAFFDSIKPNIRKMSADQKLDFQIEILKLLKNYSSK